uniref:Uncharacterized protein n=1 Tax=Vitis vinifera TaxID=29760 RepID=F6I215_VITVI
MDFNWVIKGEDSNFSSIDLLKGKRKADTSKNGGPGCAWMLKRIEAFGILNAFGELQGNATTYRLYEDLFQD